MREIITQLQPGREGGLGSKIPSFTSQDKGIFYIPEAKMNVTHHRKL